jgi:carbon-monoxide dehydrogenase medium subunit
MGTIGGSISFADPGLDYPPALVAAGAEVEIASTEGRRIVAAREFFVDWYMTALEPGQLVTAVFLPRPEPGGAGVYIKHARVSGDYATASVAACLHPGGRASVAVGSCGPTPIADDEVNELLSRDCSDAAVAQAGALLVKLSDPLDDVRGSADYRRALIPRLLLRAVRTAQADLKGSA